MLKTRTTLKSKTPLKSASPLKSKLKPVKQKKPAVNKLKKEADRVFSLYVRYRDGKKVNGEWFSQCITSGEWLPIKKAQAGHFMSRRHNSTRFEEENVNTQSYRDNVLNHGEQYKYSLAVDLKYGDGTAQKLSDMSRVPHRFTVDELQEIINNANESIKFYEHQGFQNG